MKNLNVKTLDRASLLIGCSSADMASDQSEQTTAAVLDALRKFEIDGANLSQSMGIWKGSLEKSVNLTIINNFTDASEFKARISALYLYLKEALQQEEITVVIDSVLCNL